MEKNEIKKLINIKILLKETPSGKLKKKHFEKIKSNISTIKKNEVLIKTLYISIDAANRAWLQSKTYRDQVFPGDIMGGYALGKIVFSNNKNYKIGDYVEGDLGWQKYSIKNYLQVTKAIIKNSEIHALSILGITGRTAFFGIELASLKKGETVLISAAAGAVGSIAGQIAKIKGCKVVGLTGSDEKSKWIKEHLGFDETINYNSKKFSQELRTKCPEKINVYFDNVGGKIFEKVLFSMRDHGRIICCGAISQYNQNIPKTGPRGVPGIIVTKRLSLRGFIVLDFQKEYSRAEDSLLKWLKHKKIKSIEDIVYGIENTPSALIGLLNGNNIGKRLVKIIE